MMKKTLACLIFVGFVPLNALAYDATVHYYTTAVIMKNLVPKMSDAEMKIVSFCAQLPDETIEYDAAMQYRKFLGDDLGTYFTWSRSDYDSDAVAEVIQNSKVAREMITVQQLLHGLTGGDSNTLLETAKVVLEKLTDKISWRSDIPDAPAHLCSVGFAVHLLGDAIAHRVLGSGGLGEEGVMYQTGSGHFNHGTVPDYLLTSATGLDGWQHYSEQTPFPEFDSDPPPLFINGPAGTGWIARLLKKLQAAGSKSFFESVFEWSSPNDAAHDVILQATSEWAKNDNLIPEPHDNQSCQAYLNKVFPLIVPKSCVPACQFVWSIFAGEAIPTFEAEHSDRKPALKKAEYYSPAIEETPTSCPQNELSVAN